MLDSRHDTLIFLLLSRSLPHMLEAIRTKQINLHLIRPSDIVPVIHVLCRHVFSKLLGGFLMYCLQKRLRCRVWRMVWPLIGWPPHHLNLCSNADSTPTPIFQRKHLDVTLSTCAQLLWTTYLRPVLSGPLTIKTMDDLSHCAEVQFQGVGNLLVVLAIFM